MTKKKIDDPLLTFFHNMLENEEQKEILTMIFMDYSEEKMLQTLINYKSSEETNA